MSMSREKTGYDAVYALIYKLTPSKHYRKVLGGLSTPFFPAIPACEVGMRTRPTLDNKLKVRQVLR